MPADTWVKQTLIKIGAVATIMVSACGGGGSSSSGGAGGTPGGGTGGGDPMDAGGGGAGGVAASAGVSGGGGAAGSPCGNSKIDTGEDCDGNEFGGATCESMGVGPGTLSCKSDCTASLSNCDCGGEVISTLPIQLQGTTNPQIGATQGSNCGTSTGGPSKIYRYDVSQDATLMLTLNAPAFHYVSVRTSCSLKSGSSSPVADELSCGDSSSPLSVPVTKGTTLSIVVQGEIDTPATSFTLDISAN